MADYEYLSLDRLRGYTLVSIRLLEIALAAIICPLVSCQNYRNLHFKTQYTINSSPDKARRENNVAIRSKCLHRSVCSMKNIQRILQVLLHI